jgi:hypothetical protein
MIPTASSAKNRIANIRSVILLIKKYLFAREKKERETMNLRFHAEALEQMGIKPVFSDERLRLLEEWEKKHQRALPAALKELYALEGIEEWFEETGQDFLVPLSKLSVHDWSNVKVVECAGLSLDDLKKGTVHFLTENQWVNTWEVLLDGSDDPPVLVNLESQECWITSPCLSDFFLAAVWDHALLRHEWDEDLLWGSVNFDAVKDLLRRDFRQFPVTYGPTPDQAVHRFQKGNWRVRLDDGGYGGWIGGWKSEEEMGELMRLLHFQEA